MAGRIAGWRWTALAALVLTAACSDAPVVAPNAVSGIAQPTADVKVGKRTFRARDGRLFELDVATGVLTSGRKSRELPKDVAKSFQRVVEQYTVIDAKVARFEAEPCVQQTRGAIESRGGSTRKFRVTSGGASAARLRATSPGLTAPASRLVAPFSAPVLANVSTSQVCIETSEAIYNATQERNSLQLSLADLAAGLLDNINWFDPTSILDLPGFVKDLIRRHEDMLFQLAMVNLQLDVLAAMFDAYGCWEWQGGGGGGGGGGSPPQQECHNEWQTMEQSNDGGETWFIAWEGWVRICTNVT